MNGRASVHWGYEPNALMLYYATGGTSALNVGTMLGIGRPRTYVPCLVPTHPLRVLGFGARGNSKGELC